MACFQSGFTLVEVLLVVGIVGILAAVGAPPLMNLIAAQRVKTATVNLYADVNYARSQAIMRNAVVSVVPRAGNFSNGYDISVGGTVLRSQLGTTSVTVNATPGINLAFDGYGRLTAMARYELQLGSPIDASVPTRCLIVSMSGRASIRTDLNHDGNCING